MTIDIEVIKEMREATEFSFSQIKKALEEAGGDKAKAMELLKAQGAVIAQKKADRTTGEGAIGTYVHNTGKTAAMVKLLCETDFVARNPLFKDLARELAMHIAAMDPESMEQLMDQTYIKDSSLTIKELLNQAIAKLGENIRIESFARYVI